MRDRLREVEGSKRRASPLEEVLQESLPMKLWLLLAIMRPIAPPMDLASQPKSPLARLLSVAGLLIAIAGTGAGCMPPTPAQKATDAARELNMAARWGRMDEARDRTAPENLAEFRKHHANWHGELRIVETELAGLDMKDATHATVEVDVSWMFDDDPTLRVTRLTQEWSDEQDKWVLDSEKRLSGDPGLFGEEVVRMDKKKDKHFPSRVIH